MEKLKSGLKDGSSSKVEAMQTMVNNYQVCRREEEGAGLMRVGC